MTRKERLKARAIERAKRLESYENFINLDNYVNTKLLFAWLLDDLCEMEFLEDEEDLPKYIEEAVTFYQTLYSNWKHCNHEPFDPYRIVPYDKEETI